MKVTLARTVKTPVYISPSATSIALEECQSRRVNGVRRMVDVPGESCNINKGTWLEFRGSIIQSIYHNSSTSSITITYTVKRS